MKHSYHLSEVSFKYISNEGLRQLAGSQCRPFLRTIEGRVDDSSLEAIQCLCKACPNIRSLVLWNDVCALDGDFISHNVAQYCPLMEQLSTERWTLTDAGLDALALVHTLENLESLQPNVPVLLYSEFSNLTLALLVSVSTVNMLTMPL